MNYFLNIAQAYDINCLLTTGGKLLYLCQEFEKSCKFVIPHMMAVKNFSNASLDEYIKVFQNHSKLGLGQLPPKSKHLCKDTDLVDIQLDDFLY